MKQTGRSLALHITQLAMLSAIIILMAITPLGYLRIGPLSITFLTIPVVLGAIILGPLDGAILGAVFGATSFAQCFGADPFGAALLAINPWLTFVLVMIPRVLIGMVSGYLFKLLIRTKLNQIMPYALASLSGALTNTVLFLSMLALLFTSADLKPFFGENIVAALMGIVATNGIAEAIAVTIIGGTIAKAVDVVMKNRRAKV